MLGKWVYRHISRQFTSLRDCRWRSRMLQGRSGYFSFGSGPTTTVVCMCLRVLLLAFNPCVSKQVTQVCEQKQFVFLIYGAGASEQMGKIVPNRKRQGKGNTHYWIFICFLSYAVTFSRLEADGKLVMGYRRAPSSLSSQVCGLAYNSSLSSMGSFF